MLGLTLYRKRNEVLLTVPPSDEPTEIRVLLMDSNNEKRAHVGFDAPQEVSIERQDQIRGIGKYMPGRRLTKR